MSDTHDFKFEADGKMRKHLGLTINLYVFLLFLPKIYDAGWLVQKGTGTVLTKIAPDDCVVVDTPASTLKRDGVLINERL